MAQGLILETTLLIDLERGSAGAERFLEERGKDRFYVTPTIAGEVAAGASMQVRKDWVEFVASFHMLPFAEEVSWQYGVTYRFLQANGMLIGANDLWIAAAGLAYAMPVVTRNARHFGRVPGLDVIGY